MDLKTYFATKPRGTASRIAAAMGVSASYLSQMVKGESAISPARAVQFEQLTNGECSRQDIKPDEWRTLWPELAREAAHG